MRYVLSFIILLVLCYSAHAASVDRMAVEALESSGEVPIIVVMKDPARGIPYSTRDFSRDRAFDSVGSFSGTATRKGLETLANDPNVAAIQLDKPVRALLSESAPLINASMLWPLKVNGINITGAGETVCIIDTGIDYNHAALGGGLGNRILAGYNFCANELCTQENTDPFDNHGHGTHVAGIIASSNNTYRGVAPEANLIAIKVLNSAGVGSDSDVIAGMNWCIANATAYNISVISMSLGGDTLYTGNCDSNETAYSTAVNAAITKNISVIIASGNDASNTSMVAPGCIANATSVGSVYDANVGSLTFSVCSDATTAADKVACYTNRNSLLDLMAPGSRIISANDGGGFIVSDGTSMATPHVSGAFALLRQYKRMENGTLLGPGEIENILKATGTNISDSRTGLNFSRINLLAALISIDAANPAVSISSPQNRTFNSTNVTLSYSASDGVSLNTCTFTNVTGGILVLPDCSNTTFIASENVQNNITVSANDSKGNVNSTRVFFVVDTVTPLVSISSPQNTTYNLSNITVNYSVSDLRVDRCWLINSTGSVTFLNNQSGGSCSNTSVSVSEAQHNVTIYVNDTGGNINNSIIHFTIDLTAPQLSVLSPENKSYAVTNISVNYTVADFDACWITNVTGHAVPLAGCSNTTILAVPNSLNNITVFVNDSTGNVNSVNVFFTVDTISPLVSFTSPTPHNETLNTTNDVTINVTLSELPSSVLLEWNGGNITMNGSGMQRFYNHGDLPDGNYTFRVVANDSAGNINVTAFRWVFINATRNVTTYIEALNSSFTHENVTVHLLNSTGVSVTDEVFVDVRYTLRFNITGIVADIADFLWLEANTSNFVNITRNVTIGNVSLEINSSGGIIDNYIWVDVNNFTTNYTPKVNFNGAFRLNYYLNGSRESPSYARINETCNNNNSNLPCYSISGSITTIRLSSFSGVAAGNDTQSPSVSVASPSGAYSSSNISLEYFVSDNVGLDKCWHILNSGQNMTIDGCTNTTIIAAAGSNTIILYANDTSGNINSSSAAFAYNPPAVPSSSGSGGGGGGSVSATPSSIVRKSWNTLSGSGNVSIASDAIPVKFILVSIAGAANSPSVTVSPEASGPAGLQNVYQYFSINATNLASILTAEITFAINRTWVDANGYGRSSVTLNRFIGTWQELPTRVASENLTHITFISESPGFSYFAITAEPEAVPEVIEQEQNGGEIVCAQVITPAIRNGKCILFSTPCDVPEDWTVVEACPAADEDSNTLSTAMFVVLIIITVAYMVIKNPNKKRR